MARAPLGNAASAAAAIRSASASVFASGFSHSTCLPACRAAIAIGACTLPGAAMSISWTSSRAMSARQSVSVAAQPSRAAADSAAARSRPQMAASRGRSGRSNTRSTVRQAWEWARPMNA